MLKKILIFSLLIVTLWSCSGNKGSLVFTANGEEFIADGFTSKEGWELDFEKVLLNLADIEAYYPGEATLSARIESSYTVDLKDSFGLDPSVSVATRDHVPEGNYQSLRFSLKQMQEGQYKGYSLVMIGTARKEGQTIPFTIALNEELTFDGVGGYVGDSIKGIVKKGEKSDVEMTFHFDHLFGNGEADREDHVNIRSPGFDFFRAYMQDGLIRIGQESLVDDKRYDDLIYAIESLGHLGEGHCEVSR